MKRSSALGSKVFFLVSLCLMAFALNGTLLAQDDHSAMGDGTSRPELERESPIALNSADGLEIGAVYEAYLSPQQEGGEEEDTPALIPPQFRSTTPSTPRNDRTSRGHSVIEFTRDLSRAYVYLAIENVNVADIVMLHLHCGRPGQLGPIIIDFSVAGSLQTYLEDGVMRIEVTNEDIEAVTNSSSGPVDGFTKGCAIVDSNPLDKVKTIAGMEIYARRDELYFNLHTSGQVYFGDIRGQFHAVNGG